MVASPGRLLLRRGADLYLFMVALATVGYALLLPRWSSSWILSDWLINYEGGFVRRGLAGQALLELGRWLHIPPKHLVVPLALLLYTVLLLGFRALLQRSSWNWWVLFVVFSPATLAFPVLYSEAGFHKEVFFLASLVTFALLLRRGMLRSSWATGLYLLCALMAAVLSHEALFFYAPYFFAALVLSGRSLGLAARQCAAPFGLAAGATYLCTRHPGSLEIAQHICASLGYPIHWQENGVQVCDGGAIPYLRSTPEMARAQAQRAFARYHYFSIYAPVLLASALPVLLGGWRLMQAGYRREVQALAATALCSCALTSILFAYTIDWGRWIYIHVFSIAILLLLLDGRAAPFRVPATHRAWALPNRRQMAASALLAIYATLWAVPEFYVGNYRFGYVGLVDFVFFHRHSIDNSPPAAARLQR